MTENIVLSTNDKKKLTELLKTFKAVDPEIIECVQRLRKKMETAVVVEKEDLPENSAQLNSLITVGTSFGRKVGLELVLPDKADFHKRKLSVISTLGTALLGVREGEKTLWHFPKKNECITIEKVDNSLLE